MSGWRRDSYLRYCSPTPKIILFGAVLLFFSGSIKVLEILVLYIKNQLEIAVDIDFNNVMMFFLALSCFVILIAILERIFRSNKRDIMYRPKL